MSKNICPFCKGKSEYLEVIDQHSSFLCIGCEIKIYDELHDTMNKFNLSKEDAFRYLKKNNLLDK